jgi:hypothetical protein
VKIKEGYEGLTVGLAMLAIALALIALTKLVF